MILPSFTYDIQFGPFETPDELEIMPTKGNCRRAIQLYFQLNHRIWLPSKQVLCPALFRSTGRHVGDEISKGLEGDILMAERIRNKEGLPVDRSRKYYKTEDEWILSLHSAILITTGSEKSDARIWHATSIAGGACEWSRSEFEKYYRVVAVKRILDKA